MSYQYTGYLKSLLSEAPEQPPDDVESVVFTADDLAKWSLRDSHAEKEWEKVPANRVRTELGVRLSGRFEEIRQIDNMKSDEVGIWAPLGSYNVDDDRFPVDVTRYPIAEITYRCLTDNARPAWMWTYPGGMHLDALSVSREWVTVARRIPHFGFPTQIDRMVVRLYSCARTTESMEVQSIRFRAMTPDEESATARDLEALAKSRQVAHYPILESFLPLGVYCDGQSARTIAEMISLTWEEYWALTFEDFIRHHHNCMVLEKAEKLTDDEWRSLLTMAERFNIKILPIHQVPLDDGMKTLRSVIESRIRPSSASPAVFAWCIYDEPPEQLFKAVLDAKDLMHEADPNHPLFTISCYSSTHPLYAPVFPASGIAHYTSHAPWEFGEIVRAHLPLCGGQQFWVVAPAFVYATGTPEWSTCPEMRLLLNSSLGSGARGFFTYAYHNEPIWVSGSCQRSLTGPFLAFSDLWIELDKRMLIWDLLAPMVLCSSPAPLPKQWYAISKRSEDVHQFPEGVAPTNSYRLRGPNFNLYVLASNDVRGMATVYIDIPPDVMKGLYIYDLTDCIQHRKWVPMDLSRHLEMFPGQARTLLVAERRVCESWRDIIFRRLVEDDLRQMDFDLRLATSYNLNIREVESLIKRVQTSAPIDGAEAILYARAMLFNQVYATPVLAQARSQIIEVSAIICACDGALCRLLNKGKAALARDLGEKVLPLSAEFSRMRILLRQGKGQEILDSWNDLAERAKTALLTIRSHT